MYQEVVVKEALTPQMIAAGAELTRRLDDAGFDLVASFWLYTSESNQWLLVLASPYATAAGPIKAYRRIREVLYNSATELDIPMMLWDTTVREHNDPLVTALRTGLKPRKHVEGRRVTGSIVNDQFIEDAYVYRVA